MIAAQCKQTATEEPGRSVQQCIPKLARTAISLASLNPAGWRNTHRCFVAGAYIEVYRPRVDELVRATRLDDISKGRGSALCDESDQKAKPFFGHPIWPMSGSPRLSERCAGTAAWFRQRRHHGRYRMKERASGPRYLSLRGRGILDRPSTQKLARRLCTRAACSFDPLNDRVPTYTSCAMLTIQQELASRRVRLRDCFRVVRSSRDRRSSFS
jgi:hypothetical protein